MLQLLPGWQQPCTSKRQGKFRPRGRVDGRRRLLAMELLEERAMLSVAQEIQDQIAPYQNAINTALDIAMPLVGHQFHDLQDLTTLLQNSLSSIQARTSDVTASGNFQIAIALPTISTSFTFDLGLDALLQVNSLGTVAASLTPTLNVGFDFDGDHVSLDKLNTNLDLGFTLSLPNLQVSATLHGFLFAHLTDTGTSFSGHLKFRFDENN